MRSIGLAQRALDAMIERVTDPSRKTFGKYLYQHGPPRFPLLTIRYLTLFPGTVLSDIAKSRADIEGARLLVLSAALQIDKHQAKGAMKEVGIAKVRMFR
jgi:acyl-CoA dehydrogenase